MPFPGSQVAGFQIGSTTIAFYAMSKASPKMPIAVQETKSAGAAGGAAEWAVGSLCMAKYAADGKFYPAQVTEVTPKGVKVSFTEYENEFQVCAPKDLKVFVVKGAPAKAAPKAAPLSPKQGPKAAPVSPKQGAKAAALSPSLGPMKPLSPRGSPKFAPVDPVKQATSPLLFPLYDVSSFAIFVLHDEI
jgi:hypothetical protein